MGKITRPIPEDTDGVRCDEVRMGLSNPVSSSLVEKGKYKTSASLLYTRVCLRMDTKVKDLTVGELQSLISDTIRGTLEDVIEDIVALSSDEYLRSIAEARRDYNEGNVKPLEEIIDV
jgi:hypothetical protein